MRAVSYCAVRSALQRCARECAPSMELRRMNQFAKTYAVDIFVALALYAKWLVNLSVKNGHIEDEILKHK